MSAQNRYRIASNFKSRETEEWTGWLATYYGEDGSGVERADTWQDAIQKWLDRILEAEEYTVVSESKVTDRSGIIEIQYDTPWGGYAGAKIRATLLED